MAVRGMLYLLMTLLSFASAACDSRPAGNGDSAVQQDVGVPGQDVGVPGQDVGAPGQEVGIPGEEIPSGWDGGGADLAPRDSTVSSATVNCGDGNIVTISAPCVALVEKLLPCCEVPDYVWAKYYAVFMRACDPEERMTDADCMALDTPSWIDYECDQLFQALGCLRDWNWSCQKIDSFPLEGGCGANWECSGTVYEVKCTGVVGNYDCICLEDDVEIKSFVGTDFCGPDIRSDLMELQADRANAECGWKVARNL